MTLRDYEKMQCGRMERGEYLDRLKRLRDSLESARHQRGRQARQRVHKIKSRILAAEEALGLRSPPG